MSCKVSFDPRLMTTVLELSTPRVLKYLNSKFPAVICILDVVSA